MSGARSIKIELWLDKNECPIKLRNGKINPYRNKPTAALTAHHVPFISRHSMQVLCRAPARRGEAAGGTSTARLMHGFPGTLEPPTKKWVRAALITSPITTGRRNGHWPGCLRFQSDTIASVTSGDSKAELHRPAAVGAAPAATRSVASRIIRTRAWVPGRQVSRNALLNDLLADLTVSQGRCVVSLDVP
jgi:hypothetical protein